MKHVITGIQVKLVSPLTGQDAAISLPIIPGTGSFTSKTFNDGLTEELTVTARIQSGYPVDSRYLADQKLVTVSYSDDEAGSVKSVSFGSLEIPARFTMEDSETMSIKCTYKRVL